MAGNRRNNWIEDQIKRFGEDFVFTMSPESIQRNAKRRIFSDMVKGNIDYGVHGKYFNDPKFLENLIIAAENELLNNEVILTALMEFDMNHPGNSTVIMNRTKFNGLVIIYRSLVNKLHAVKMSFNVGYLVDIPVELRTYRNYI